MSGSTNRMIAPLEFSKNAKMVSGETAAAITQRKPTTEEARIAVAGTPRRVTADQLSRRLTRAPRARTTCATRCTSPN